MSLVVQKITWLGVGILCGFGLTVGIGFYNIKRDSGQPLVGPKLFGDMRIYRKPLSNDETSASKGCKTLVIEKNGVTLVQFDQREPGELGKLLVFNDSAVPVVQIKYIGDDYNPILTYGKFPSKSECTCQEFIDIDMDGQFDFMLDKDKNGKTSGASAYFKENGAWEIVTFSDAVNNRVKVNGKLYEFCAHDWKEVIPSKNSSESNRVDPNEKHS